jgi:hypothetical protein
VSDGLLQVAAAVLPFADHSMGAAAIGFAAPPLLVFIGLGALVIRERLSGR